MKEHFKLDSTCSNAVLGSPSTFKSAVVKNIKFSNSKDSPTLNFKWVHGKFGETFLIPISSIQNSAGGEFDLIKMCKDFDEPFNGPFKTLDISLAKEFKNMKSKVEFEIEIFSR